MKKTEELEVDEVVDKCLEVKGGKPGKLVQIPENQVKSLCTSVRTIFLDQSALLELEAPLKICGDVHGQYHDLLRLFEYGGFPPESNYLFLGDYVDRGKQSLETIILLFAYKVKFPENFFLLRGNHECASITRIYGFYDECKRRYNIKLWKQFCDVFNCMSVCAIIDEKIVCMHGGLSPEINSFDQVKRITRPTDVPDTGLICDLLWADPDKDISGWAENDRGVSFIFGPDIVGNFLQKQDMDLVCRAHQVVEDGYEFFAKRQLITLFSAPNYCGEFDNAGAMMSIDDTLMCSFKVKYPENFFLLRGNHECASITRIYGFYDECKRRVNIKLWKQFCDVFNCMPVCAIIDEKIICMHGGLSPEISSFDQVKRVVRPTDVPDTGLICDLLWADPDKEITGWAENDRGVSFIFGPDVVSSFLQKHEMDLVCRAHQVVEDGYEFFAKRQLITLFSAPNYCGEFDNAGAMMSIDESLMCSFKVLKPSKKR